MTDDNKLPTRSAEVSRGPHDKTKKRPYSPPKIEEFGSVLELTKGTGVGTLDTAMGTTSVKAV